MPHPFYLFFFKFQSSEKEEQDFIERDELENHQHFIDDEFSTDDFDLSAYHR